MSGSLIETRPARSIEGVLERDRLGWPSYVKVDGRLVKFWLWDALERVVQNVPKGTRVRLSIEVLEDD